MDEPDLLGEWPLGKRRVRPTKRSPFVVAMPNPLTHADRHPADVFGTRGTKKAMGVNREGVISGLARGKSRKLPSPMSFVEEVRENTAVPGLKGRKKKDRTIIQMDG